jgi:exosortase E/protease (VPEID-CTERM system)
VLAIAVVLFCEKSVLNRFADFAAADTAQGLGAAFRDLQHYGLRLLVSLGVALAVFIYVRHDSELQEASNATRGEPIRWRWLACNLLAVTGLAVLLPALYGPDQNPASFALQALACLGLGLTALLALLLGAAPLALWVRAVQAVGRIWLYALAVAGAATLAIRLSQSLWKPAAGITFELVHRLLRPWLADLQADPATQVLSTHRFAVEVSDICSGLEGLGLMLVFCVAWLVYFRRDYRFPRALVLLPAGLLLVFALNVLRIAALVLIGDAGYPEVAIIGFHSQAGWIAFNGTACLLAFGSLRVSWLTQQSVKPRSETHAANAAAAYLVPLLAILGAGMLARAGSGTFEWLYPLRLLAVVPVLYVYRRKLAQLDWRFSWRGPLVGAAVFGLWLVAANMISKPTPMPAQLAAAPEELRLGWILVRCLVAVLFVPVAEELAYRGFLMRRLQRLDFEALPFASVGPVALLVSSALFGMGHGSMSVPAIAAGLAYGALLVRGARFGEAVAAHAVSNLLIAAAVVMFDQWQLW